MAQAFDPADELDDFDPLCGQEPLLAVPQHSSNGRYVLLAALGAGAAAQVFQAIDTSTGEEIALKVLLPGLEAAGSPAALAAGGAAAEAEFGAYAALGATLEHPRRFEAAASGIPLAYGHGILEAARHGTTSRAPQSAASARASADGNPLAGAAAVAGSSGGGGGGAAVPGARYPYVSLQLLGPDLFTLMEHGAFGGGPEGRQRLAEAGRGILKALQYMHARGIIHGDLKPENVVAARRGGGGSGGGEGGGGDAGAAADKPDASFYIVDFGGAARLDVAGHGSGRAGGTTGGGAGAPSAHSCITPSYASAAALRGAPPAPADDLESLCCVMLWLATGQLPWEDVFAAPERRAGRSGGGGWSAQQLRAMGDTKERLWREQIEGGAPPHLMPSWVADAYTYVRSVPRCGAIDYGRLAQMFSAAEAPEDPGTPAWRALRAERKRRRAGGAAAGAAGARGPAARRARRGSSGGWAGAGACGALFALLDGGGEE